MPNLKMLRDLLPDEISFTGSLPSTVLELGNLIELSVQSNPFSGNLFPGLGSLQNLVASKHRKILQGFHTWLLVWNKFTGVILQELGNLVQLRKLDLKRDFKLEWSKDWSKISEESEVGVNKFIEETKVGSNEFVKKTEIESVKFVEEGDAGAIKLVQRAQVGVDKFAVDDEEGADKFAQETEASASQFESSDYYATKTANLELESTPL